MLKSFFVSTFILLCATIIESSILSNISFLYVIPDLVLICVIYFSLLNGKFYGETTGFISGLFLDFITGVPLGFNSIIRTLTGYIFGFFSDTFIITGVVMPVITVGAGTIGKVILENLTHLFFPNLNIYTTSIISYEFLFEFLINIIVAPFFFKFLGFFINQLSIKNVKDAVDNA